MGGRTAEAFKLALWLTKESQSLCKSDMTAALYLRRSYINCNQYDNFRSIHALRRRKGLQFW